jgi:hypothetical protein
MAFICTQQLFLGFLCCDYHGLYRLNIYVFPLIVSYAEIFCYRSQSPLNRTANHVCLVRF